MAENSNVGTVLKSNWLYFAGIVLFFAFVFRNSDIYPSVFPDEYCYSVFSRLLPFEDSTIPSYVYLAIYRSINICSNGSHNCAVILNTAFFVATMPFIYLTTRQVSTRLMASIVALLAVLGPINIYTTYYMPEALYFLSFWLLTWFILRLDNTHDLRSWCFAGILLGLCALVKSRALFFLPAIVVYILFVSRKEEGKWVVQAIRNAIIFVAFAFAAKFSIGYFLAGKAGLTILGSVHGSVIETISNFGPVHGPVSETISNSGSVHSSVASGTISKLGPYFERLSLSIENAKGHILAICLMFGAPIAFAIKASFDSLLSKEETRSGHRVAVYTLLVLITFILVVSLVNAYGFGLRDESVARLHMRYYNCVLPLLLVIAASQLSLEKSTNMLKRRVIVAFPIGAAILYAVYTFLAPYTPNLTDCPELHGFTFNWIVFYVLSGISFFALALWVYSAKAGAKIFLCLLVPLAVGFSTYDVNEELGARRVPSGFDRVGIITKQLLSKEELSRLVIVGSDYYGLWRSMFYLDNPTASFEEVPQGAAYDLSRLPVGKEWILVIGDHSLPENVCYQLPMGGFTLARATCTTTVDFTKSLWLGVIASARGLFSAEPWGTWSSGDVVTLEFSKALPEKFAVHLVARAFGPNVGKKFVAHAGDSDVRFTLAASPGERVLEFSNPQRSKIIKIDVPTPCSPKELGLRADQRSLGIGLTELRIESLSQIDFNADAYYNRGVTYCKLGNYRQAISDFDTAIEINPKHAEAYYYRSVAYAKLGNRTQAIEDLKTAAKFDNQAAKNFLKSQGMNW